MDEWDLVSWNSLISSYGVHGFGEKAIQVSNKIIISGILPSPISFISILGACCHAGFFEDGKMSFNLMVREHRIFPSAADLLGRANRLHEAG